MRKDQGETGLEGSPKVSLSEDRVMQRSPTPEEQSTPPSAFEIGDDDDSENEEEDKPANKKSSPPQSPTSGHERKNSMADSVTSIAESVEDAVPMQVRGMSEKARGKLPEGAFQRHGSTTSLASHVSSTATAPNMGFAPTNQWVITDLLHVNKA